MSRIVPWLRWARSASRHLLLLNVILFASVWVLYGTDAVHGYGEYYFARSNDFWLQGSEAPLLKRSPGIENALVPGIAAIVRSGLELVGLTYGWRQYLVVTIVPYALFVYFVGVAIRRRRGSSGLVPAAAVVALYGSGLVPYMTTWGGYVDGMAYLLLVPVLVWPRSFAVFACTFVLQALNHYLGAMVLLLLVCLQASLDAVAAAPENPREAMVTWTRSAAPRLAFAALVVAATSWYWSAQYPFAALRRPAILEMRWREAGSLFVEVFGAFPFTVLSTYKLVLVPMAMLALLTTPRHRWIRTALLVVPALVAGVATALFVDVTRVGTLLMFPLFWMLIDAVTGHGPDITPAQARQLRRVFIVSAAFSLLVPNYYVNNGDVIVPPSRAIRGLAYTVGHALR